MYSQFWPNTAMEEVLCPCHFQQQHACLIIKSTFFYGLFSTKLINTSLHQSCTFTKAGSVFNKGRQPVKLAGYSTWTRRLFDWEITLYFMTNVRNICFKTWASDGPRFIHEKQKNLAWILSNFRGDLCFLFCSNTLILVPECRKCILRGPNFQNFTGEHTPRPPQNLTPAVHSLPIPKILPPIQISIENRAKGNCPVNIPTPAIKNKKIVNVCQQSIAAKEYLNHRVYYIYWFNSCSV